jgi:hypothetical protein
MPDQQLAMDTTRQAVEGSTNDSLVIQEAKALIEKLNLMLQVPAMSTVQQPTQQQDAVSGKVNDTTSEFSSYSMLTPSATSVSELDEGKSLADQQADEKVEVAVDEEFHAPVNGVSDFNLGLNTSNEQPHSQGDAIAKEPPKNTSSALQAEYESESQKSKLIGIVVTFERGVALAEGLDATEHIGNHLSERLGALAGHFHVISIHGQGQLEVETKPQPESHIHLHSVGHYGEPVAILPMTNKKRDLQDQPQESARIQSTTMLSFPPPISDPWGTPAILSDNSTLLSQRIELAKARTLRALLDSVGFAFFGTSVGKTAQDAAKSPETISISSDIVPTISQLIDIAKAKVHRELTKYEQVNTLRGSEGTSVEQKTLKIVSKSPKSKGATRLGKETFLVVGASASLFTIFSLVLCIASMNAKTQGHCVGIWLGS